MPGLEIRHIAKSYGDVEALKQIDLSIAAGEFICLLGESGCGKTTLLRLIAGLETPSAGELLLDSADLTTIPAHERNIGMVFQSLALFPHLNVAQNIAYGIRMRGQTNPARVEDLLSMVGLTGLGNRRVSALSGGQRQRVAIARALAVEPRLFLMDEPFSALDAGLREHLQVEVKKLQQELGITTIFVTHDQREAMALADRIVVMNQGKIEQAASPAQLYSKPETTFVANFIGTNNVLDLSVSRGKATLNGNAFGDTNLGDGTHTVALRPEHLTLGDGPIQGTVTFAKMLGALRELEVQVGETKIYQTQVTDAATGPKIGDQVSLGYDPANLWAIPR